MKMSSSKRDLVAQQLRASVEKRAAVSARDRFGRDHALFETQFTSARGALESLRRTRETFESKQLISTYQRVVTATKTQFPKINYKQLERVEELREQELEARDELRQALEPFEEHGCEYGCGVEPDELLQQWRVECLPRTPSRDPGLFGEGDCH
ncbi:UNVERIFIED_ASMBLY: tegument protein UL14 [human gammaherpesvirus 4]|nr:tegument protein UL14 [human gammaherpesvirus 4]